MEKDVDPEIIKKTQLTLGKYIKRPPLNEKLLRKPPFRFLHDIITGVLKSTGFFGGLFEENELNSENVKDRDSKLLFLTKTINVLSLTTGQSLAAKPTKIVAGQEPEKTNELLQCIAEALDKNLSSVEAVKKYKDSLKTTEKRDDKKQNDQINLNKRSNIKSDGKLTSRSTEKLTQPKRESSRNRNEQEKNTNKSVKQVKAEQNKPVSKQRGTTVKNKVQAVNDVDVKVTETKKIKDPIIPNHKDADIVDNTTKSTEVYQNIQDEKLNEQELFKTIDIGDVEIKPPVKKETGDEIKLKENNKGTKSLENSSDIYIDPLKLDENNTRHESKNEIGGGDRENRQIYNKRDLEENTANDISNNVAESNSAVDGNDIKVTEKPKQNSENNIVKKVNETNNTLRPPSVRPPSARPGAPRLRDKYDDVSSVSDQIPIGKVKIIIENSIPDEDDEPSLIVVDSQDDFKSQSDVTKESLDYSAEHGHLVQQILNSQKEYSQTVSGKTEIEWEFSAQKARETVNQEIEQLRFNLQALSRVANPLGKLLDHIQEDVEVMRQELQEWMKIYEEASQELTKQKIANEDSLIPLHTKIKQLDVDVAEKRDKINDLKSVILKNSTRIDMLLTSGNVQ